MPAVFPALEQVACPLRRGERRQLLYSDRRIGGSLDELSVTAVQRCDCAFLFNCPRPDQATRPGRRTASLGGSRPGTILAGGDHRQVPGPKCHLRRHRRARPYLPMLRRDLPGQYPGTPTTPSRCHGLVLATTRCRPPHCQLLAPPRQSDLPLSHRATRVTRRNPQPSPHRGTHDVPVLLMRGRPAVTTRARLPT